jgi:3',5'-cyclic AMP phosphodiesterase CpdA
VFTLAHLSDLHINPLAPPRWRDLANKRATGFVNWWRKRRHMHDAATLEALLADVVAQRADHVAVTGDVAHIGLPAEFAAARPVLEGLGTADNVSFIPGNHDIYVEASRAPLMAELGRWMTGDDGKLQLPWLKVRGHVAMIGLNSAIPTKPFDARGRLGPRQIDEAEMLLRYCHGRGLITVVMIHHPPHRGGAKPGRELIDAGAFEEMLARAGAHLVIHGHNHTTTVAWRAGPAGPVPIVGVPSASIRPGAAHREPAGYHLITIGDGGKISVVRRIAQLDGSILDAGELSLVQQAAA